MTTTTHMTTATPATDTGQPTKPPERNDRRWRSVHVHLDADRADVDRFVTMSVRPVCDELVEQDQAKEWFFIRYWEEGPHVRIRLRDATPEAADHLAEAMRNAAATVAPKPVEDRDPDARAHGSVTMPAYEPEIERYGGERGVAVSEAGFCVSSRLIASVMARPDFDRFAVATAIINGTLRALSQRGVDPAVWLRRYLYVWHSIRPETRDRAAAMVRVELLDADITDRPDLISPPTGLVSTWSAIVDRLIDSLTDPAIGREDYRAPEILVSHVHMALNRLGISIEEEAQLLIRALPTARPDNDQLVADPTRSLWDASSFAEWDPPSPPGHLSPMSRLVEVESPVAVDGVDWSQLTKRGPRSTATIGLIEALERRRSAERWQSTLTFEQLGELLRITHGPIETGVFEGDTFTVEWAKRGYPSAGMSFPVFARIAVGEIDGMEPGLYEYDPITSQLVQVYPNGGLDLSLLSCGWFLPDDLTTRPAAVIWLCCDLSRIRPRYEQRALRFSLIEVGHVAQNLCLGAAALDIACRPVGGFFDEVACLAAGVDGGAELPAYAICVGGTDASNQERAQ